MKGLAEDAWPEIRPDHLAFPFSNNKRGYQPTDLVAELTEDDMQRLLHTAHDGVLAFPFVEMPDDADEKTFPAFCGTTVVGEYATV